MTALNRNVRSVLLAALMAVPASAFAQDLASLDDVRDWSNTIWLMAKEGEQQHLEGHLQKLPDGGGLKQAEQLRAGIEQYQHNLKEARAQRKESYEAALEKLNEHLAASSTVDALNSVLELQELGEDPRAPLAMAEVKELAELAGLAASRAQSEGRWLEAQDLLLRLRTIYDDVREAREFDAFDRDLKQVNRRITLLAYYAPERLYALRQAERERQGQDALPPYNSDLAADWTERVRDVEPDIVRWALRSASTKHVEDVGLVPLLRGGLDALHVLATTPALADTFEGLGDEAKVAAWNEGLGDIGASFDERDFFNAQTVLQDVQRLNRDTLELPDRVVIREFGDGAMSVFSEDYHDPHSEIVWPDEIRRFRQAVDGEFVGVGILIRHDDKRQILVVNPLEGSPAFRASVKAGDLIVEVDGKPTVGWSLNDAVDSITGKRGTNVTLGLKREGVEDVIQTKIRRNIIKIYSINGWWKTGLDEKTGAPEWDWFIDPDSRIAYIRMTEFTQNTSRDLLSAWKQMSKDGPPAGLILDLRYNPGGLLDAAVSVSNMFVERGMIVSIEDRKGNTGWADSAKGRLAHIANANVPTVVLINQGSASASEIVAGCLQAHDAAIVVGRRSYGKGSVQTVHRLRTDNSRLKLTTQYYRLPAAEGEAKGRLVHKRAGATDWGVNPDVVVSMTPEQVRGSLELRKNADIIPEDENGKLDPNLESRPDINGLLIEGLDPQLETALLLLQVRALGATAGDRHARK